MKFKSIFLTALAAVAVFASCQKPEEDFGKPALNLDNSELTFTQDASTQTLNLTSSRPWAVKGELPEWLSIDPMNGEASKEAQALDVTVLANEGMERIVEVTVSNGTINRILKVTQAGPGGSASDKILYFNNFDKTKAEKGDRWSTYLDTFEGWKNETGSGIAGISYTFSGMTARTSSTGHSAGEYSLYTGSGVNYLWFGTDGKFFLKDIALNGNENLEISFGAERNNYDDKNNNVFNHDEFKVYVSNDAAKWVAVDYTFAQGTDPNRKWDLATSKITVPAGTEKLSVAFIPTKTSTYAMDDLKLAVGAEKGTEIDFSKGIELGEGGGDTPTPQPEGDLTNAKLGLINAAKDGTKIISTEEVLVVATHARGYLLFDGTDYILAYTKDPFTVKVGDRVVVSGEKASHNGWAQIASPVAEVKSSGNAVKHPTPNDITSKIASFKSDHVEYLKVKGILNYEDPFLNVDVKGVTSVNVSIAYADAELLEALKKVNGSEITLEGYFIGGTSHLQIMVVKYDTAGDYLSPDPIKLEFTAAAGEQTFTVNTNQASFEVVSSDPTNFAVTVADKVVTVKATENTTTSVRTANITVTAGAMTKVVEVSQEAPLAEGETKVTMTWNEIAVANGFTDKDDVTAAEFGDIKFAFSKNGSTTHPRTWSGNQELRLYKKNTIQISGINASMKIKSITFNQKIDGTANAGTLTGAIWQGDANSVTITLSDAASRHDIKKLEIVYTK